MEALTGKKIVTVASNRPEKISDAVRTMKKFFFLILSCCAASAAIGQEEFVEPSRKITSFNFLQLTGGVIIIQGQLHPFPDTLNFILDTGSGGISLDSSTADYFGLHPEPSNMMIRGIGGIRPVSFLKNQQLHLPGLTIDNLNFHVNDYEILTSVYGERIDGIIGYSIFSRYIIKLNYDDYRVEFWTQGSLKYPSGGFMLRPIISSTLPVNFARVRDHRTINTRFLFDIGAGLNMMLSSEFINDSTLLKKKRKMYEKEAEGLGGKIDLFVTLIKEVKLGPYKFRNVPVEVFDDTYNVTSYPYLGGILGNDLLRRFNAIIDYKRREIYLTPNTHLNDPFDYAYSGITLYYIDGVITVGNVSRNSPAEKAGIREGDVVLAINKDVSQNLNSYKNALQTAGQYIKMIIMREDKLIDLSFKVGRIK